jgi:hypothetical protein
MIKPAPESVNFIAMGYHAQGYPERVLLCLSIASG